MTRKDPGIPVPDILPIPQDGYITQTRKYKVITPLYGGGEEPGKPDSITVVRGAEVRGHLRFWWRATRGGAFNGNLHNMKRREEEIWGSAGEKGKPGPSKVKIALNPNKRGNPFQAKNRHGVNINNIGHPNSVDGYVAFPLREEPYPAVIENVEFELKIEYPKQINGTINIEEDIAAALWAWETFGGIGARTRRGFGALQLTHIDGKVVDSFNCGDFSHHLAIGLRKHLVNKAWPKGVPHIVPDLHCKSIKSSDVISAWRYLVQKLREFRQARYPDQNNHPYGRSKWPEADAIRRLPGMTSAHKHKIPRSTLDRFPRGKFGLPIIFQFKENDVALGDPGPTTLQGEDEYDRLASPLILRPVACSDGAVGLAVILEWEPMNPKDERYTPPGGLVLKGAPGDPKVSANLTPSEASSIPPLKGKTDILQAFLDFLK